MEVHLCFFHRYLSIVLLQHQRAQLRRTKDPAGLTLGCQLDKVHISASIGEPEVCVSGGGVDIAVCGGGVASDILREGLNGLGVFVMQVEPKSYSDISIYIYMEVHLCVFS